MPLLTDLSLPDLPNPSCFAPAPAGAALLAVVRARDAACHDHCDRVTRLVLALARRSGVRTRDLAPLGLAAGLHDLGKIGVPDAILHKPGRLDEAEWKVMQQHPVIGEEIVRLAGLPQGDEVASLVRWHHEHFDGSGYPDGLRGHDIPLGARILTVCDIYDALGEQRVYRAALAHEDIMAIMAAEVGIHTDPVLFERLERVVTEDGALEP